MSNFLFCYNVLKSYLLQMVQIVFHKGEIDHQLQFCLLPYCFRKSLAADESKCICMEKGIHYRSWFFFYVDQTWNTFINNTLLTTITVTSFSCTWVCQSACTETWLVGTQIFHHFTACSLEPCDVTKSNRGVSTIIPYILLTPAGLTCQFCQLELV